MNTHLTTYTMAIVIAVFGAIMGSFLNVCIYRLARNKSIVTPDSFCPTCEKPIRFFDNVPIISFLLLKGKCRHCGSGISARYPIVELLTAVLFVSLYEKLGISFELFVNMFFLSLLVVISFIDLDYRIIPDVLSIGGLAAGFILSFFRPSFHLADSLFGILLGGGILYLIAIGYQLFAKREGMGGGDIKLLGMIGAFCGMKGVIFALMSSSLIGTAVGIPLMLIKGKDTKYAIPFGPFLSLSALIFVFAGESLVYGFMDFIAGG